MTADVEGGLGVEARIAPTTFELIDRAAAGEPVDSVLDEVRERLGFSDSRLQHDMVQLRDTGMLDGAMW